MDWTFFDRITVISVPETDHRLLKSNFSACGLVNYQIRDFLPAQQRSNIGEQDLSLRHILRHDHCNETCANIGSNHLQIIEEAYRDGVDHLLIFEDDAYFDQPFDHRKLSRMVGWLASHQWDVFYLGQCPWPIPWAWLISRDLVKVYNPLLAHSYALSRSGMQRFLHWVKQKPIHHIDRLLCDAPIKKVAAFPSICFQRTDPGLYRMAQRRLPIPFNFRAIMTLLEWLSVIMPLLIIAAIILILFSLRRRSQHSLQTSLGVAD